MNSRTPTSDANRQERPFRRHLLTITLGMVAAIGLVVGSATAAAAATQTISGTVNSGGMTVASGDTLRFDPDHNTTLVMSGNLIIRGTLIMKPANGNVDHVIRFQGFDENNFVGGGMDPVSSDVGLWVVDGGRVLLEGEQKTAWSYTYQSSWVGDEVRAAPNTPGSYNNFPLVTSTPTKNALGYSSELLNLTRNVRVEGTTSAYTHVFIRSTGVSTIKNALFRYMAPDFGNSDSNGRYGIHFHHNGDSSRGTVVDGLVIRDTKGHAFVPHMSNGITFRDVIGYNVRGEVFWWDEGDTSDDILYDRAVAANVRGAVNGENHHRLGAFYLGLGENNSVTNSVVVGMQNENGAARSGFIWPEDDEATWFFKGNRAHNNDTNGIFVWQNNELPHVIEDFTAYYHGQAGIEHGAYTNSYVYKDLVLLGNDLAILSHALGEPGDNGFTDTQIWSNLRTDGGTLVIDEHARPPERPVRFVDCDLGEVVVDDNGGAEHSEYDFIRCGLEPGDFDLSGAKSNSVFRVQRANGTAYRLTGNGSVTTIGAFYNGTVPGSTFSDTNGHVFETAIEWLAEEKITIGCNPPANTKFCPNDFVTRGQMAAFFARAFGYSDTGTGNYFTDSTGSVFKNAIAKLRVAGVTFGCNPPANTKYCPTDFVTRGQMAAFLARAFGYSDTGAGDYFIDDDGNVFEDAIDKIRVAGVTQGCNPPVNNKYCPKSNVTRGQMAAFLKRAMGG